MTSISYIYFYRTDLIFHALDPSSNEIVDFDTFIANLDEEIFFDAIQECRPETITVRQKTNKLVLC